MELDDGEMHLEEEELMDTTTIDYHRQKNNNQLLINDIRVRMNWIIGLLVFLLIIIIYQFFRPSIIFYQTTNHDPSSLHLSATINDNPSTSIHTNNIAPSTTSPSPPSTTTTTTTSSAPLSKYPFFILGAPLNAAIVGAIDEKKIFSSVDHRAVIITGDSRPINSSLQSATVPMNVLYANQFNYDVHYFEYQPPSNNNNNNNNHGEYTQDSPFCDYEGLNRAASWCKLPVIIQTLEQMDPSNPSKPLYDWLLWLDTDAMIMTNLSIPHLVQSLVDVPNDYQNCSVFYGSNHPYMTHMPNAGVFFIKNDVNARHWIKKWWNNSYNSSNLRFPWEQELLWNIWSKRDPPIRCDYDNPAVVFESLRTMDENTWKYRSLPIIHIDHTRRNFLNEAVIKALQNNPSISDQSKSTNVDESILRQWFDKRFHHIPIYLFNN